ncbi:hypothetical protein D9611_008131 [Ephemerocybe angulata]|uniref:Uncharacterized protein n=1 Tax=Ephemerocybe angulata TaxID=980116 RepID=A0A8H5BZQ0_9AGAR|nr:hypothetical protein D9611_008131 [Tulosesus angulatus]
MPLAIAMQSPAASLDDLSLGKDAFDIINTNTKFNADVNSFDTSFDNNNNNVWLRQPHAYGGMQIIQLVEADAPPPARSCGSSFGQSSGSSYWSSDYSESACSQDEESEDSQYDQEYDEEGVQEDREEEEVCSSYCSSAEGEEREEVWRDGVKETLRMKRILAWREDFYVQMQDLAAATAQSPPSRKRKLSECEYSSSSASASCSSLGDNSSPSTPSSRSSKRSRSDAYSQSADAAMDVEEPLFTSPAASASSTSLISSASASASASTSSLPSLSSTPVSAWTKTSPSPSLCAYACAACEASFVEKEELRAHGEEARGEGRTACGVAVEYAFE